MHTSPTIGQIAVALAAAQAELRNPAKDRTAKIASQKGNFSYTYADFATALDAIRPVLAKHKIAFVQATRWDGSLVMLETRLIHESGEWVANDYPVGGIGDHRTMGSALSYARRYSLFPMIGVQGEEDDDGEASQERPMPKPNTIGESLIEHHIRKMREAATQPEFEEAVTVARGAYPRLSASDQKRLMDVVEARRAFWMQAPGKAA